MLKFLKKLFGEPEEDQEVVALEEVGAWFEERSKPLVGETLALIASVKSKILAEIDLAKKQSDVLRNAELHNPHIEVREKHFMQGNRNAYLLGIEALLRMIQFPESNDALEEYHVTFTQALERFTKATVRSYQILQHFFANETRELALRVKSLEGLHTELHSFAQKSNVVKVRDAIKALEVLQTKKTDYERQLRALEEKYAALDDRKKELQSKLTALQSSDTYRKLLQLKAEKANAVKQLREHYSSIRQPFSALKAALKKYERIALEGTELIKWYLHDAVEALERDEQLKVVSIVEKLEKAVASGAVDLRDKKKERALVAARSVPRELLLERRNELFALRASLYEKGTLISSHAAATEEVSLENDLSETTKKSEQLVAEQAHIQHLLENIDLDATREQLSKELTSLFKKKIMLS